MLPLIAPERLLMGDRLRYNFYSPTLNVKMLGVCCRVTRFQSGRMPFFIPSHASDECGCIFRFLLRFSPHQIAITTYSFHREPIHSISNPAWIYVTR